MMIAITVLDGPNDHPVRVNLEHTQIESILALQQKRVIRTKSGGTYLTKETEQQLLIKITQAKLDGLRQAGSMNEQIRQEMRNRNWDES